MQGKRSGFSSLLSEINRLDRQEFSRWHFPPGTGFGDMEKWWQSPDLRPSPHEGLDFCRFVNREGTIIPFGEGSLVPVLFAGKIVRVFDDFLGRSVMVGHDLHDSRNRRLHSIYAHLRPARQLEEGQEVDGGDIIAAVAPVRGRKIPPHLHLSTIWIAAAAQPDRISWEAVNNRSAGELCDPLGFLEPTAPAGSAAPPQTVERL